MSDGSSTPGIRKARNDEASTPVSHRRTTATLLRLLVVGMTLVLGASLVVTLAWAIATVVARPLDGVEGDVFFEADRIRSGLPLYTDPTSGALEYGPPPSRYLVLYPPLWSAALSLVPREVEVIAGRVVASTAWFGLLAILVWRAPKERRRVVAAASAFVAGTWVLALYGANARPDAVAVLASGLGLERAARLSGERSQAVPPRQPSIDVVTGVLFALAVWTKPNVLGAAPGAFVACLLASTGGMRARIRTILPGLVGVLSTSLVVGAVLHVVSKGAWLTHLLASTGQPPNATLWLGQIADRGPFFLLPLFAALVIALRARRDPGAAIAAGALLTSIAWTLLSLAKIGSASNYFMEPCVAMLVVLSRVDLPPALAAPRVSVAAVALLQVAWNATGSITGAGAALPRAFERASTLADVRRVCGAEQGSVVLADEPGLELALNGRLIATPFQTTHLARRGRFPVEEWVKDVASPRAQCLVMQDDLLERSLTDDRVAHDRFGPELRRALAARFELVTRRDGYWIYRASPPPSSK
jgi:hypothetical protein